MNQIVIVTVIVSANEVVSDVDGDDVVEARRWIVPSARDSEAVDIAPVIEEEVGSIGVVGERMVVEVEAVVLPEEDTAAAFGDSLACSLLLDMVVLVDWSVAVEEGSLLDREEAPVADMVSSAEVPGLRSC